MVSLFGQKGKNFQSFLPFVFKPTQIQFSIRGNLDFYIDENTLRRNVMLATCLFKRLPLFTTDPSVRPKSD